MKRVWRLVLAMILAGGSAWALGPHEVLVLVNGASSNSVDIARTWTELRQVPDVNVVSLNLPEFAGSSAVGISPDDFSNKIWTPALKAVRERRIGDHILAWVYSVDFPTKVNTAPAMSIQGITFLRNRPVPAEQVEKGTYVSPLYAGPMGPGQASFVFPSASLDTFQEWLGSDMPLPSMMLGYIGERGNSREEILRGMKDGVASDRTTPRGTVYFVKGDDIRSKCRHWQYPGAQREIVPLGLDARIVKALPAGCPDILGLMVGQADVNPGKDNRFLPGSMAEHLTSAAGVFESAGQTKMSAWIRAGATASAGTVVEPMSIWTKFPSATFYVHYARGCSILESFFQSIGSPLQILLLGEPLAKPWGRQNIALNVQGLPEGSLSGQIHLKASVKADPGWGFRKFLWLLDGRTAGTGATLDLDTAILAEGEHKIRVVAYGTGLMRDQVFGEKKITVVRR